MGGETESNISGWTTDTLKAHFSQRFEDSQRALDERFATQTKANEVAFTAQQTAMQTALTAAERAVQTALQSAEKAVTKAEVAAERRFEAVNEFRGQLADQAATLLTRTEADSKFAESRALATAGEREFLAATGRNVERITALESRLDTLVGHMSGGTSKGADLRANLGAILGGVSVVLVLVLGVINVLTH